MYAEKAIRESGQTGSFNLVSLCKGSISLASHTINPFIPSSSVKKWYDRIPARKSRDYLYHHHL